MAHELLDTSKHTYLAVTGYEQERALLQQLWDMDIRFEYRPIRVFTCTQLRGLREVQLLVHENFRFDLEFLQILILNPRPHKYIEVKDSERGFTFHDLPKEELMRWRI